MRAKGLLALALTVLVITSVWYVQRPPRSADAYRERAVETVEALRSQVQTTRIWVRSLEHDEATRQAASVGFREAEEDATRAASSFESHVPPTGTARLRARLAALAGEVTEALAAVRIAAERGEWRQLPARARPLPELSARLHRLKRETR